jgi:hypothetical protein
MGLGIRRYAARPYATPAFRPGPARPRHAGAARERRGLPIHRTARRLELVLQLLVFTTQPLTLRFRATEIVAQTLVLAAQLVDGLLRIARRGISRVSDRTCMPDTSPVEKYKELMATI